MQAEFNFREPAAQKTVEELEAEAAENLRKCLFKEYQAFPDTVIKATHTYGVCMEHLLRFNKSELSNKDFDLALEDCNRVMKSSIYSNILEGLVPTKAEASKAMADVTKAKNVIKNLVRQKEDMYFNLDNANKFVKNFLINMPLLRERVKRVASLGDMMEPVYEELHKVEGDYWKHFEKAKALKEKYEELLKQNK